MHIVIIPHLFPHGTVPIAQGPQRFIPESTSPLLSSNLFRTRHLMAPAGCIFTMPSKSQDIAYVYAWDAFHR